MNERKPLFLNSFIHFFEWHEKWMFSAMTRDERRLVRHLVTAVVVKLLLLTALWWLFVRDARVPVDPEQAARRIGIATHPEGAKP